jgi:DNA invertase Pin-like site-specific DNA recombinase
MATIAEWYSGNLSEEAKKGMRKKAEAGGLPGRAPLGYINERVKTPGKDIAVVRVDPVALLLLPGEAKRQKQLPPRVHLGRSYRTGGR